MAAAEATLVFLHMTLYFLLKVVRSKALGYQDLMQSLSWL